MAGIGERRTLEDYSQPRPRNYAPIVRPLQFKQTISRSSQLFFIWFSKINLMDMHLKILMIIAEFSVIL
ncbi:putative transcription initiation factor [Sesbania bispinosa]|nr:putative transcription initiation factor [Sesbania bispinosa]